MSILRPDELNKRNELFAQGIIKCADCGKEKTLEEFSPNAKTWSGRHAYCKPCCRLRDKAYRQNKGATKRKSAARKEMLKRNIRQCGSCQQIRPLSDYGRHTASTDGYRYTCKLCQSKQHSESLERRKASDPMYRRLEDGRKRAKAAGLPYEWFSGEELREHWVSQGIDPDRCVCTGTKLGEDWQLDHVVALSVPDSPGHVLRNCVPASPKANLDKKNQHLVHYLADRAEAEKVKESA